MKLLRDLFMGPGNLAWDLARFGAAGGFISFFALSFYKVFAGQEVSLTDFGTGFGAIALAVGGLIALKDRAHSAVEQAGKPVEVINPPGEKLEVTA